MFGIFGYTISFMLPTMKVNLKMDLKIGIRIEGYRL